MTTILGSGEHRYRVVEDWAKLPDGWEFKDVAAVAVDSNDSIYAFNRGEHPMMVFDRDGNFLRSWGEGVFRARTACTSTPDDISIAPTTATTRAQVHLEGKALLDIGMPASRRRT